MNFIIQFYTLFYYNVEKEVAYGKERRNLSTDSFRYKK